MSQSIFEQYDIFKTMHPVKVEVMKELSDNMKGKSMKDAAPLLMTAMNKLKSHNLSFTQEETKVLMEIMTKGMSQQDMSRVEMVKQMIKKGPPKK